MAKSPLIVPSEGSSKSVLRRARSLVPPLSTLALPTSCCAFHLVVPGKVKRGSEWRAGSVAQLVECLSGMHETLGLIPHATPSLES